jgi:hypothetical protein
MILQKIDEDTKPLEQLLRSIHYQEIAFNKEIKLFQNRIIPIGANE